MRGLWLAAVAISIVCGSARADWQYTKWGMTVEQVSGTTTGAKLVPDGELVLKGTYEALGSTFGVRLVFQNDRSSTRRLTSVFLTQRDPAVCARSLLALREKAPGEVIDPAQGSEKYLWRDVEKGNLVTFLNMATLDRFSPGGPGNGTSCMIEYKPLAFDDNGL